MAEYLFIGGSRSYQYLEASGVDIIRLGLEDGKVETYVKHRGGMIVRGERVSSYEIYVLEGHDIPISIINPPISPRAKGQE